MHVLLWAAVVLLCVCLLALGVLAVKMRARPLVFPGPPVVSSATACEAVVSQK